MSDDPADTLVDALLALWGPLFDQSRTYWEQAQDVIQDLERHGWVLRSKDDLIEAADARDRRA